MRDERDLGAALLAWYDRHARVMPWRVAPADRARGVRPDPYRVWLSEIMLQQTTVAAVTEYYRRFVERWPTVADLAAAADGDVMGAWAGLGYYARARNLLKGARAVVADHGGVFPGSYAGMLALPGVGPYTAGAVAAIAYDEPALVVDGNVERVMARMFAVETPLPGVKPALLALAARLTPALRPGDHAQAVMDLGATVCTPRRPACGICPWMGDCRGRALGIAAELPRRAARLAKPVRFGRAYVARRADGAWLLERRAERGLLGGMLGWPGPKWRAEPGQDQSADEPGAPPLAADWHEADGVVLHTFTHFHLRLRVSVARVALDCQPGRGEFVAPEAFRPSELPTVMRKVFDLAQNAVSPLHPAPGG